MPEHEITQIWVVSLGDRVMYIVEISERDALAVTVYRDGIVLCAVH